jgi:hypothetical protein
MRPTTKVLLRPVIPVLLLALGLSALLAGCPHKTSVSPTPPGTPTITSTPTATLIPGQQWAQSYPTFTGRYFHTTVAFNGSLWTIAGNDFNLDNPGGSLNDVWSSSNGTSWSRAVSAAAFSPRFGHTSVAFNSQLWVMGGWDGTTRVKDVWSSSNGVSWAPATLSAAWSQRNLQASVTFNSQMWVIGGNDGALKNDVWSSSDGAVWSQATASAAFTGRSGHSATVFDPGTGARIWVIGGNDGAFQNDVWSSLDGANWSPVTVASFAGRAGHVCLVYDSKLWLIGGFDGTNALNDVWSSPDGANWTLETANGGFSLRYGHGGAVFGPGPSMWIVSGRDGLNLWIDVWRSP